MLFFEKNVISYMKNSGINLTVLAQAVVDIRAACTRTAGLIGLFFTNKMKKIQKITLLYMV